ncbi:LuxR C-terminal-related transcriptional regulator [Streptomyces sp. NPDC059037]|uniref:LuxR C-terminal-related transcriptional regulator n=1 Tax=Streptomyces sp. NPDC059037 TaxID=3346710 RepID=UPI0036AC731A
MTAIGQAPWPTLTWRQREIIQLLAQGASMPEAAAEFSLSRSTVESYVDRVKEAFGPRELPALLHVLYERDVLAPSELTGPSPDLSPEQQAILRRIAQGESAARMATELRRPVTDVRRDARALLKTLGARNPAHAITRGWAMGLLGTPPEVRSP